MAEDTLSSHDGNLWDGKFPRQMYNFFLLSPIPGTRYARAHALVGSNSHLSGMFLLLLHVLRVR